MPETEISSEASAEHADIEANSAHVATRTARFVILKATEARIMVEFMAEGT
jgi:hypothetical protein